MTRSPYAAYQIGKRGGKHLIGPGANSPSGDSSDDADIDWSTRRDSPEPATETPWGDDAGGEPTESL
jgi:type IV secretion system protein TrbL